MSSATSPIRVPSSRHVRSETLVERPRRLTEVVTTPKQRRARPRIVHAFVAVGGVLLIVGAQLLLSIAISGGAYRISDLQQEQRALTRESESLTEQLSIAAATQHLAGAAASLGMVPAQSTYFLDLASGGAVGAPGMPDTAGCGGACNLVPNSLTQGLPAVLPQADPLAPAIVQQQLKPVETPPASTGIPAPVTH